MPRGDDEEPQEEELDPVLLPTQRLDPGDDFQSLSRLDQLVLRLQCTVGLKLDSLSVTRRFQGGTLRGPLLSKAIAAHVKHGEGAVRLQGLGDLRSPLLSNVIPTHVKRG